jgi:hypothetical protein
LEGAAEEAKTSTHTAAGGNNAFIQDDEQLSGGIQISDFRSPERASP